MSFQLSGSAPEIYENTMVPLWMGRWADNLLRQVSLKTGEIVLDVACGTGVTTRIAKRDVGKLGSVTGLDINANMLVKAQELATEYDIKWMESDVTETGLHSDQFDAIISQHGYHYFADPAAALKEFHRLLAPNGRIALSIWDGHSAYTEAICTAVEKFMSPEIAAKQRSQRDTPSATVLGRALTDAGYKNVDVIHQELSISVPLAAEFVPLHLGSMPIAGAFNALPRVKKAALIADVAQHLSGFVHDDRIIYEDAVNIMIGVK